MLCHVNSSRQNTKTNGRDASISADEHFAFQLTHRRPRAPLRLSRYALAAAIPARSAPLISATVWCHAQADCTAACLCSTVICAWRAPAPLSSAAATAPAFCFKPGRCVLWHRRHLSESTSLNVAHEMCEKMLGRTDAGTLIPFRRHAAADPAGSSWHRVPPPPP